MASFHILTPIHTAPGGNSGFNRLSGHFGAVSPAHGSTFEWHATGLAADGSPERVN